MAAFTGYKSLYVQPATLRYMAPERFLGGASFPLIHCSSKESDVYSLAMTSFSVCTFFWKLSYCLKRLLCCDQVLTGALPYHGDDKNEMIASIRGGKRPSRPTGPSRDRRLQDPVWDVIMTGWSHEPEKRCELSVVHDTFVTASQQEVYSGDLNDQNDGNLAITETYVPDTGGTGRQRRGKILPRIASFFQFLQNSESDLQRQVNEMNSVSSSTLPPSSPGLMWPAAA